MSQKNVDVVRRSAEAYNRRDVAGFEACFAEDAEIVPLRAAVEGTVDRGPGAAARFLAGFDDVLEGMSVELEEVRDGPDWVLALGFLRGRGLGSGADVEARLSIVVRFRDGLITSFRVYPDRAAAFAAVGLRE